MTGQNRKNKKGGEDTAFEFNNMQPDIACFFQI